MDASKHGSDAVLSSTQLVQYEDDEDNDDKINSSHSDQPIPPREVPREDAGKNNEKRISVESELASQLDARAQMDIVEAASGNDGVSEDDRAFQDDIDGGAREEVYMETSLREELVVQESRGVSEGGEMGTEAVRAYVAYDASTDAGHPQATNTSTDPAMGSGNDFSQDDVQERSIEETALEEGVNVVQSEHPSFSGEQQLQLRAQILVYGDLIKGLLPKQDMMSSAFSDDPEASGQESQRSSGGWNWEKSWEEARLKAEATNAKGDVIMTEGDVVNAVAADNLEPGTPSTSPSRVAEEPLGETVVEPAVMPEATDRAEISEADLDVHPTDINGDLSVLTVNLDAVVENIAATVNSIDTSVVKDSRLDTQGTRSPSLDPWLKPQSSQQNLPAPGPVAPPPVNAPSATLAATSPWVSTAQVSTPVSGAQLPTTETPTPVDGDLPASGPPVVSENADPEDVDVSRKRKGRGRGRGASSTPRQSRGKNARVSKGGSPGESVDPNIQTPAGPSRLANEVSAVAAVTLSEGSPPATPNAARKKTEAKVTVSLHAETQSWLEQAKVSFEEAVSAANSAAEQVEFVRTQGTPQDRGSGRGSQLTSALAAVNAAASVAKAAADAAKVAYEAAVQATLIVADGADLTGVEKLVVGNGRGDKDGGLGGRRSAIAAAKEEARKRAKATPSSKTTPQSTDAVLRAARLMAEAATQAGAVLANFGTPGSDPQSPVAQNDAVSTARGRGRKSSAAKKIPEPAKVAEESPLKTKDAKLSLKKGARKKGKDALDLAVTKSSAKKTGDGHPKSSPEKATRRQLDETMAAASNVVAPPKVILQGQIAEGSLVEVMNEEEGLRGGWFSARVLQLKAGEVCVQYDEILTDDGSSQLKEWFPLEGPLEGPEPGRPRIRAISADSLAREEGRRKRRRTSFGLKTWSIGDRVDAFVQDGWWEGIVKEVDEDDENKIKVYFPGEGDTTVIKSWNLRPSFVWKNGRWEQWSADVHLQQTQVTEGKASKKQKVAGSPKVQARKSKQKVNPPNKGSDDVTEVSRPSRSRKTTESTAGKTLDLVGNKPADLVGAKTTDTVGGKTTDLVGGKTTDLVGGKTTDLVGGKTTDSVGGKTADPVNILPPSRTTRNSPKQKITPKRKVDPVKLSSPETEVVTPPTQVSARVSTRTRPAVQDAENLKPPKGTASVTGTPSNPNLPVSSVGRKRENPTKKKGSSPSKSQKLTHNVEPVPGPQTNTAATRRKTKAEGPPQTRRSTRVL